MLYFHDSIFSKKLFYAISKLNDITPILEKNQYQATQNIGIYYANEVSFYQINCDNLGYEKVALILEPPQ